jgi:hypothetical protein
VADGRYQRPHQSKNHSSVNKVTKSVIKYKALSSRNASIKKKINGRQEMDACLVGWDLLTYICNVEGLYNRR